MLDESQPGNLEPDRQGSNKSQVDDMDHCSPCSPANSKSFTYSHSNLRKDESDARVSHLYVCDDEDDDEDDSIRQTRALREVSDTPTGTGANSSAGSEAYLTLSGTIQRGRRKGQCVEVVLNMSREELEMLEMDVVSKRRHRCAPGPGVGVHVLLWSIICSPVSLVLSAVYSFFLGTLTWYSVFAMFAETRPVACRVLVPPLLIVLYPFFIVLTSLGLGLYAGLKQVSWCWTIWLEEFTDYEKGFYGWLCNSLDIPECSPYDVVILSNVQKP